MTGGGEHRLEEGGEGTVEGKRASNSEMGMDEGEGAGQGV